MKTSKRNHLSPIRRWAAAVFAAFFALPLFGEPQNQQQRQEQNQPGAEVAGAQESRQQAAADAKTAGQDRKQKHNQKQAQDQQAGKGLPTPQSGTLTDADIVKAVEDELSFDSSVRAGDIKVESKGGTLTLTGSVPNLLSKERAGMIAEAVRGVRSVVNRIEVQTAQRSDADIRRDVLEALRQDPAADAYEIAVASQNGIVTLSEAVDSWQEKELAGAVAKRVKGVREVINILEIQPKTERADSEIAADVESALEWDTWIRSKIHVEVNDGRVVLSGTVGSAAEKQRVRYNAFVTGVKSVDDEGLNVDPSRKGLTDMAERTPQEIQRALKDAFLFDPRVNSFNPDIEVEEDGTVTLTGTVDNLKAKRAAQQVARNTKGVKAIKNELTVRTDAGKDDQRLLRDIGAALMRDPFVDRYDINVKTDSGKVTLGGKVDSSFEKRHAEDVVSRVNGVIAITNNLSVEYPAYTYYAWPYSRYNYEPFFSGDYNDAKTASNSGEDANASGDDSATAEAIRTEMFWSPFVDADQVDVAVSKGVATLNGKVNSWGEYNAAMENAYEGGADRVESHLKVGR